MKLLQINITANRGSTGRIAEEIGRLAIVNGWESYIAYGRAAGESESKLIHIGNMWDERWHGVQTRLLDRHGLASRRATRRLIEAIEDIKPDIIQLHNIHGYYLNYPILFEYLAKSNVPIVWTLHDCWTMTGHCSNFDSIGCMKWKTGCHDCQLKRSYPAAFCDRSGKNYLAKKHYFNLPKNMTIVTVSNWLKDVVSESFLSNYPIRVITSGIDLNSFKRSKHYPMSVKRPVILGVASVWTNLKGLADFIKLSEHKDIQIILVGLTSVQINKLPKNIIGINRTSSQEELAEYYSMADVFVNPTYEDTFGLVNVEAQACGTPVVSYRTGGCPETISPNTGVLVEKGDVDGLYSAIKSILSKSPAEREAQRRACIKRAKEFDAKVRFKDYINLYERLLTK